MTLATESFLGAKVASPDEGWDALVEIRLVVDRSDAKAMACVDGSLFFEYAMRCIGARPSVDVSGGVS